MSSVLPKVVGRKEGARPVVLYFLVSAPCVFSLSSSPVASAQASPTTKQTTNKKKQIW